MLEEKVCKINWFGYILSDSIGASAGASTIVLLLQTKLQVQEDLEPKVG